jgi:hypothetical protein
MSYLGARFQARYRRHMDGQTKRQPGRTMSLPAFIAYRAWSYLTWWPWEVRQFKAIGCVRTGWMTWELPPAIPFGIGESSATSRPLP